jgi:hypothetical protein
LAADKNGSTLIEPSGFIRVHPRLSAAQDLIRQHLAKRAEHFPHLGLLIWKDIYRIHRVNRHSAIHFDNH